MIYALLLLSLILPTPFTALMLYVLMSRRAIRYIMREVGEDAAGDELPDRILFYTLSPFIACVVFFQELNPAKYIRAAKKIKTLVDEDES